MGSTGNRALLFRLHPATRLALCLPVLALLPAGRPVALVVVTAAALGFGICSGLGRAMALRLAVLLVPVGAILAIIHGVLIPRGVPLPLGPVQVYPDSLAIAGLILLRLAALMAAALLVVLSTTPGALADGLEDKGLPAGAAYLISAPLALAGAVAIEVAAARDALQVRGLPIAGGPIHRMRAVWAVVLAVIRSQLVEITPRAMALEARGFRAGPRRTLMQAPDDSRPQGILRFGCLALAILLLAATLIT